jgi:hypothetical protein
VLLVVAAAAELARWLGTAREPAGLPSCALRPGAVTDAAAAAALVLLLLCPPLRSA